MDVGASRSAWAGRSSVMHILVAGILLLSTFAHSATVTLYLDASASSDGTGGSSDPFQQFLTAVLSINTALLSSDVILNVAPGTWLLHLRLLSISLYFLLSFLSSVFFFV